MPGRIQLRHQEQANLGKRRVTVSFGPVAPCDAMTAADWVRDYNPTYLFGDASRPEEPSQLFLHPVWIAGLVDAAVGSLCPRSRVKQLQIQYKAPAHTGLRLTLEAAVRQAEREEDLVEVSVRVLQDNKEPLAVAQVLVSLCERKDR